MRRILIPVLTPEERRDIQSVGNIIKEELNVKDIEFVTDETSEVVKRKAKPNFKSLGPKHGKDTQKVANAVKDMRDEKILEMEKNHRVEIEVEGNAIELTMDDVEIYSEDIEGWLVATESGVTVALDTQLDNELIKEGIAREFVNRVQNLRKDADYEVTDRINIMISASDEIKDAITDMKDYISNETLAGEIEFSSGLQGEKIDLDGEEMIVSINKIHGENKQVDTNINLRKGEN